MRSVSYLGGVAGVGASLALAGGGAGGAGINRIIHSSGVMNSSSLKYVDVTIPEVDTSKSIIIMGSTFTSPVIRAPSYAVPTPELTSLTNVRIHRGSPVPPILRQLTSL